VEATKEIRIGESDYQLSRFSARDGSWIVGQFLTKGLLLPLDNVQLEEKELGSVFAITLREFSEATFESVQAKCLKTVRRVENGQPIPVLMADGRWAVRPEPDLVELTALLVASLVFNLHCFFAPGALKKLQAVFPSGSPSSPGSTDTSSDQSAPGTGTTVTAIR
jgi:hypothetical protein